MSAVVLAVAVGLLGACEENVVGHTCFIGLDAGTATQAVVASPAVECPSRTCLHVPLGVGHTLPEKDGVKAVYVDQCTAECSSADDCQKFPNSECLTGFACAIPVVVGPFCCRKLCICKDYLVIPETGIQLPAACDPSTAANLCCNLPGRQDQEVCQ